MSFQYEVSDGALTSTAQTITINVTAANDAPVATTGSFTATEDVSLSGSLASLVSDVDTATAGLSYSEVGGPLLGLTLNSDGTFSYLNPTENFNGTVTFQYEVSDGALSSTIQTITINVTAVNDAPVATTGSFTATEDVLLSGDLYSSVSDVETADAGLTYSQVGGSLAGLTLNSDGTFTYLNPTENFNGTVTFQYTVSDGTLTSAAQTITINVTAVNDAPTSINLSNTSLAENAGVNAIVGTLSGTDPDANSTLTFSLPSGLNNNAQFNISGSTLRANASFNFEAKSSYTVTVRVTDQGGLTYDKVFTIDVTNVNEAPVVTGAIGDITVNQGAISQTINLSTVFGDVDDVVLAYSAVSSDGAVVGAVVNGSNLILTFSGSQLGSVTINVTATDGGGLTASTSFGVTVIAAGSGPGVTLVNGVLKIVGTDSEDRIKIIRADSKYVVVSNFLPLNKMEFLVSQIQAIEIDVLGGNDEVDICENVLVPVTIRGGSGNDEIEAGGGNDVIYGGDGNDEIETGDGNNFVDAGAGNDEIEGGAGRDSIYAGEGNDEVSGEGGDDLLFGGAGNDKLDGEDGNDVISGGSGNDELEGGKGRDVLIGGLGSDNIKGEDGEDILIANTVTFEQDEVALQMVLAEWASSRSYSVRVANLKGIGTGTRLNGNVFLNASSILNDNAIDKLMGGKDLDWLIGTVGQDSFND